MGNQQSTPSPSSQGEFYLSNKIEFLIVFFFVTKNLSSKIKLNTNTGDMRAEWSRSMFHKTGPGACF